MPHARQLCKQKTTADADIDNTGRMSEDAQEKAHRKMGAFVQGGRTSSCRRGLAAALAATVVAVQSGSAADPLPHEAYIWQHSWQAEVTNALSVASAQLDGFVVLAAETGPERTRNVTYDHAALTASGKPIGLALRINRGARFDRLPALAESVVTAARARRLAVTELQLDYDAPESKLAAYRELVLAVRRRLAPTPVTITALPSWLRQPAFSNLVAASDGFVLQVHALDAALKLCDADLARRAVAGASQYGVPFRVALPTYGHLVATDRAGRVLGVASESPSPSWPPESLLHEVRSDPATMAGLVRAWGLRRPANMKGIIWYRLPVSADRMNWRWPTLAAILEGRVPRPALALRLRQPRPGLIEIDLVNQGEADACDAIDMRVTWRDAELLACDALAGFVARRSAGKSGGACAFVGNPRLAPAGLRTIAWLRFHGSREVHCEAALD